MLRVVAPEYCVITHENPIEWQAENISAFIVTFNETFFDLKAEKDFHFLYNSLF